MSSRLVAALVLFITFSFATSLASAQTTYRWVDKTTGQTVFSDQPPPPGVKSMAIKQGGNADDEPQLPYATRQAKEKFPVTLYTSANCVDPCKLARNFLNGRGIPFAEKMLNTEEDIAELSKRLGSEVSTPSITVGAQSFRGFEAGAWNNLLDLAGYPSSAPYGAKPSGAFVK